MEFETPSLSEFNLQSKSLFSYSLNMDFDSNSDPHAHECAMSGLSDSPSSDAPNAAHLKALDISSEDDQLLATDDQDSPSFEEALESSLDADSSEIVGKESEECDCNVDEESPVAEESLGVKTPRGVMSEEKAALTLQKVYRGYRTRRRFADSAIVAEELWWQAIDYARLHHSTISFFHFSKAETVDSRWVRIGLNASRVGRGLCGDANAQKLAFQHWIEAVDPRHRYGHNLHMYYEQWYKADAGLPFFYWLDIGDGKELDLKECPRSKLQENALNILDLYKEQERCQYMVVEGKIVHKLSGDLLDTSSGFEGAKWIFVMSTFKKLYAGEKKKGAFHHSSFLAGGATLSAGRLVAEHGILKFVSTYSGHYRPTDDSLENFLSFLRENGVNLDQVQVRTANEDYEHYDTRQSNESNEQESTAETNTGTNNYRRTLSGGLRSGTAEAAKNAIWQRITSKKAVSSYQLGHQLSLKWTTGAGARIGCIADYPVELRTQALEFVNFSPREPPTPTLPWCVNLSLGNPPTPLASR